VHKNQRELFQSLELLLSSVANTPNKNQRLLTPEREGKSYKFDSEQTNMQQKRKLVSTSKQFIQ
jgi:hypothetical protein